MALSLLTTPVANVTTISAALWINEFNNIYNNALSLVSPLTGNLDFNGNKLIGLALGDVSSPSLQLTGDTNTGIYSSAADTIDVAAGGIRAASFGASWLLKAAPEDSRTNTVDVAGVIESTTSGTPAAGIGVGLQFNAESADENPCPFGEIDFAASDVTAGSEDTYCDMRLRVAGAALATAFRFQATAAFKAIFAQANTADRTYTLQDSSDVLVGRNTTDTLTNKTLTTPVITNPSGVPSILDKVTANTTVTNTVTETTVYTFNVTGGTLSSSNALRLTLFIDQTTTGGPTITFRTKYGGTTFGTMILVHGGGEDRAGWIQVILAADGATNSQIGKSRESLWSDATNQSVDFDTGGFGTAAVDSTADQTLLVTAQHSAASAGNITLMQYAILEKLS